MKRASRIHRVKSLLFAAALACCVLAAAEWRGNLLEPAAHAAGFVVSNTNDSGLGSLRQAILDANSTPGADTISFGIPGSGVRTIQPLTALPPLTDPVVIDGYTQSGTSPNTLAVGNNAVLLVELDGSLITQSFSHGLEIRAGAAGSTVRGLVVNHFNRSANGIIISGGGNVVVGGNNVIAGNFIGTEPDGVTRAGNDDGVTIFNSAGNRVGGPAPADRNLISGNGRYGILIDSTDHGVTNNVVQGNYIGTDRHGSAQLGNSNMGVSAGDEGTIIGGPTATPGTGAGNVLSGNAAYGLELRNSDGDPDANTRVRGNVIGADPTATARVFNSNGGILVTGANGDIFIGGEDPTDGNVISGNEGHGITFEATGLANSPIRVMNNFIGTNAALADLGNSGHGLSFTPSATNVVIGAATPGGPGSNRIAFNGTDEQPGDGINIQSGGGSNTFANFGGEGGFNTASSDFSEVLILSNSIHSNSGLGIDLQDDDVTPNDPDDLDEGPNWMQNFPVITSAGTSGAGTLIAGTLDSAPEQTYIVEFFSNAVCDSSGHGEGQTFIGSTQVTTDALGDASFSFTTAAPVPAGRFITATASTNTPGTLNSTSEFSACVLVTVSTPTPTPTPNPTPTPRPTPTPTPSPTPAPGGCATCGDVNGEGELSGNKGTFDIDVRARRGLINLDRITHRNSSADVEFRSRNIFCVTFAGNRATLTGLGEFRRGRRRTAVIFQVEVRDNGPRNSGLDTFSLRLSNGYTVNANVRRGNISFDFARCNRRAAAVSESVGVLSARASLPDADRSRPPAPVGVCRIPFPHALLPV